MGPTLLPAALGLACPCSYQTRAAMSIPIPSWIFPKGGGLSVSRAEPCSLLSIVTERSKSNPVNRIDYQQGKHKTWFRSFQNNMFSLSTGNIPDVTLAITHGHNDKGALLHRNCEKHPSRKERVWRLLLFVKNYAYYMQQDKPAIS
jgi:hypothetical protein